MKKRICNICKKELPLNEKYFYRSKLNKTGFRPYCKKCMNEKSKENRQRKNKDIDKLYNLIDRTNLYKTCSKCKKKLPATKEYFFTSPTGKYYLRTKCKVCFGIQASKLKKTPKYKKRASEYQKEDYKRNKDKYAKRWKHYYMENAEHLKQKAKEYAKNNREKIRLKDREYRKIPRNKLNDNFSRLIRETLKNGKNGTHWENLVNYNLEDLMQHLEGQFRDDMSWNNYGKWHIDHIIPKSWFKFESYEDEQFKQCWALANLQPLWAEENMKKGSRAG